MKISALILLNLTLNLVFNTSICQEISGDDAQENLFKIGGADANFGVVRKFDNRYEGVQGSPFYFDYWADGSIITNEGRQINNILLKYNAFEDELIINQNKTGQYYLPKHEINSFILKEKSGGTNIHFQSHPHQKKEGELQYYRIIYLGTITLLERVKVIFEKANFEGGYSNDKPYDEFKKYSILYYVSNASQTPSKLKTTTKGISKIFPDYNNDIKKLIVENAYDCKKEEDLIAVMEFYEDIK